MLDIRFIRNNPCQVESALAKRGSDLNLSEYLELDEKRRGLVREVEGLKAERNKASAEVAEKKKAGEDASELIDELGGLSARIKELDHRLGEVDREVDRWVMALPNIPHESVPHGETDEDNREERYWGEIPEFDFTPKAHWELGPDLGGLDFERAAKLAGSRFVLYRGWAARMERALIGLMLDMQTLEHGYTEVLPPFIANRDSLTATGQLPKFEADLFRLEDWEYYLIPTAEVPVINIHKNEVLGEGDLPVKYTAHTPCFRSEAGSYGKDTRGMIRQHQFNKVEMVRFTTPESSYAELEEMTGQAEAVLKRLELPYRVVTLCGGDLGFSAAKTYDIEVWLPGQQKYREISSCSNCEDFQARRANIRYKPAVGGKKRLVHILNGSGLAVGRTMVAILENFQQEDGSVVIPAALRPYMGGMEKIGP
ncbi:MAG: serine--tRNA ligase [Desulfonatronovibrionaceae bacterium]